MPSACRNTRVSIPVQQFRDEYHLGGSTVTPAVQLKTLRAVFRAVSAARSDRGPRPIVEVDVDLCALLPIHRTQEALDEVGKQLGVVNFRKPRALDILPGYSDEAWAAFVDAHPELSRDYSTFDWKRRAAGTPFGVFHRAFWDRSLMRDDRPTPGLGAFVHRVRECGGDVVFISGRWLDEDVDLTCQCLRRAGIDKPNVVIGNPHHEALVSDPLNAISDAAAKVIHQDEIRRLHGRPVAVVDDRVGNRTAIIKALGDPLVLSVAICVPGFTCDAAAATVPLRLSTFETFDVTLGEPPRRPFIMTRHAGAGLGRPWGGLYEGLGRNELAYVLPRGLDLSTFTGANRCPPFAHVLAAHGEGTLAEDELIDLCEATIPCEQLIKLDACLREAEQCSGTRAAPFPTDPLARGQLRRSLITSWLHSRDVESVMRALGYPIAAAGIHDLVEEVAVAEVQAMIGAAVPGTYSPWLIDWAAALPAGESVNASCLNPHLLVSLWEWTPARVAPQDAMDVHRLTSHHDGDGKERYDPLEAAVNNLLHQREGRPGIRKEPIVAWETLQSLEISELQLEKLGKSSLGRDVLRDAIHVCRMLEREGWLTPWGLTKGAHF